MIELEPLLPTHASTALPKRRAGGIVLLLSGVEEEHFSTVRHFENQFQALVATRFDASVSHLVVPVDDRGIFQQRTMKYMQAVMGENY